MVEHLARCGAEYEHRIDLQLEVVHDLDAVLDATVVEVVRVVLAVAAVVLEVAAVDGGRSRPAHWISGRPARLPG